uniref:Uncharacterized protein n=1 Tax=Vitis vinifera TaxID=29760 RepID=F6H1L0_VITVI
MRLDHVGP